MCKSLESVLRAIKIIVHLWRLWVVKWVEFVPAFSIPIAKEAAAKGGGWPARDHAPKGGWPWRCCFEP
jgi:hypothetical protein